MALLTAEMIKDELSTLCPEAAYEGGWVRGPGGAVQIDPAWLLMPMAEFSTRILQPVCTLRSTRPEQVRGATHGDYYHMCDRIQALKNVMAGGTNWSKMPATQREALDMIATKIGRIIEGNADFIDHWDDIIGYATLVRDQIAVPKPITPPAYKHRCDV